MAEPDKSGGTSLSPDKVRDYLHWEYAIIQGKIDKYGEIGIRLKGIFIPIATASIYFALKELDIKIPLLGLLATLIFLLYETWNNCFRTALLKRALFIERLISSGKKLTEFRYEVPRIGHDLKKKELVSLENMSRTLIQDWKSNLLYYVMIAIYIFMTGINIGVMIYKLIKGN